MQRRNLGTGIDVCDEIRCIVKGSEPSGVINLSTVSGAIHHRERGLPKTTDYPHPSSHGLYSGSWAPVVHSELSLFVLTECNGGYTYIIVNER
jgi:hypothetical protein